MMASPSDNYSVKLADLLTGMPGIADLPDVDVLGVAIDSRKVRPGFLFIAYQGVSSNGCDYIEDAINAGAVAVAWDAGSNVVPLQVAKLRGQAVQMIALANARQHAGEIAARFYRQPSRTMKVIGITGTNGKTSCSHFLSQVFNKKSPCGVIGTLGYGLYGKLAGTGMTTPDPVSLQEYLYELQNAGARHVVMEVSSHALDQDRVTGTEVDVAVFTNLSRDHLDYHDDMASYGDAKKKLFDMPSVQSVVINTDDEFGRELAAALSAEKHCISYGMSEIPVKPDVHASNAGLDRQGMHVHVTSPWGEGDVRSELLGRFNVSNLLAVIATLIACGYEFDDALQQAQTLQTVNGRMERLGGDGQPLVVVDYAHTPDALEQALSSLSEHTEGRLWCVFGCGGDRDKGKRKLMGRIAGRFADRIIITDDNPRFESPGQITDAIAEGIAEQLNVEVIHDRGRAIQKAVSSADVTDIVLIAGKGHEDYQLIGDNRIPFSDREQVEYQLSARNARGGRT